MDDPIHSHSCHFLLTNNSNLMTMVNVFFFSTDFITDFRKFLSIIAMDKLQIKSS